MKGFTSCSCLIDDMSRCLAFGEKSAEQVEKSSIARVRLKPHSRYLRRRLDRLMHHLNEEGLLGLSALFDDFVRFSQMPDLMETARATKNGVDAVSVLLLNHLSNSASAQDEILLKQMGGPGSVLGTVFKLYTNKFLAPASEKAAMLLVTEAGFEKLSLIPEASVSRSDFGSFGQIIHETFYHANVVRLDVFYKKSPATVRALVTFFENSEGAPGWVHGGIISAISDMFLARSSLILFGSSVTRTVSISFKMPVALLSICSMHLLPESTSTDMKGRACDEDGMTLFECHGSFVPRNKL